MRLADVPLANVRSYFSDLGIEDLDPDALVRDIPYPVLRLIDLARALASNPILLILDEITAALPANLAERVFAVMRQLARARQFGDFHLSSYGGGRRAL